MDVIPQSPYERLEPLRSDRNKRRATFNGRWQQNAPVSADDLADDYFYYIGYEDKVQCTVCGGILSGWCDGDVVSIEHGRHFPNCSWVQQRQSRQQPAQFANLADRMATLPVNMAATRGFDHTHTSQGENFDLRYQASFNSRDRPGVTRPKFQEYAVESIRLATYKGWPSQMKQTPPILTKAGFFYLGEGDKVKCFYCGGILWDWEEEDEPWVEHAKWFPECPWLKMAKGDDYIEQIQRELHMMQLDEQKENTGNEETETKTIDSNEVSQSASGFHVCQPSDAASGSFVSQATDAASASPGHQVQEKGAGAINPVTSISELTSKELVDVKAILEENESLKISKSCKICLDADVGVVFLPCGHICCCASCAVPLETCPICRKKLEKVIKAFLA